MQTVPFVIAMAGFVFLGVKWGGWNLGIVVFSVVFGLFLASTPLGVEAVQQITTWGNELFPKLQEWSA
ncbi:hypothetical protein [Kribbella catacumbae]|uniref:hypothetical protein n=1 Tax=Kribbella catacumbae TaxID=460086 RepID=UPI000381F8B4|nr:hypothetical protein [Kribbella catacumbae]